MGDVSRGSRSSSSKASGWLSPADSVQPRTSSGSGHLSAGSGSTSVTFRSSKSSEDRPMSVVRKLLRKPTFASRSSEGSPRIGLIDPGLYENKDQRRKTYDSPRGTRRVSLLSAPVPGPSRESESLFSSEVEQPKTGDGGALLSASLFTSADESVGVFTKPPPIAGDQSAKENSSDAKLDPTPDPTPDPKCAENIISDSEPVKIQSKTATRKGRKQLPKGFQSEGELRYDHDYHIYFPNTS